MCHWQLRVVPQPNPFSLWTLMAHDISDTDVTSGDAAIASSLNIRLAASTALNTIQIVR